MDIVVPDQHINLKKAAKKIGCCYCGRGIIFYTECEKEILMSASGVWYDNDSTHI